MAQELGLDDMVDEIREEAGEDTPKVLATLRGILEKCAASDDPRCAGRLQLYVASLCMSHYSVSFLRFG